MNSPESAIDIEVLAAEYERLRAAAIKGAGLRTMGAEILRRQGMWAWIELVSPALSLVERSPVAPNNALFPSFPSSPSSVEPLPPELVSVWAEIVLGPLSNVEA